MIVIDRERIATMIPHAGAMCLLDGVLHWDEVSVRCVSRRFRDPDNPMRRADGTLGAACGIEIAAQAMAVHGSLVAGKGGRPPARAYLASLRDVWLGTQGLDLVSGALIVDAERLMENAGGASYRFTVAGGGAELVRGRATILFGAAR
jgi:predicted hotdog family 3-hydroxylacyl-ACP dehydratase